MWGFFVIDAIVAVAALTGWYFWFLRYNRRRALGVVRWVQAACAGKARVSKTTWTGPSRLFAELRFPPQMFDRARIIVSLVPRHIPVRWLFSRYRKEKETLVFEADIEPAPRFELEVRNHRWTGDHTKSVVSGNWMVSRPGPVILTSRPRWERELGPVIGALMTSREKNFKSVRFSPTSPHLSATLEIDALPDKQSAPGWLDCLRELAAGASISRHQ